MFLGVMWINKLSIYLIITTSIKNEVSPTREGIKIVCLTVVMLEQFSIVSKVFHD